MIIIFFLFFIGFLNCIERFDKLVEDFLVSDGFNYVGIIEKVEKVLDEIIDEKEKVSGEIYVKIMKKI